MSPPGQRDQRGIPTDLMAALTKARYAVRFESDEKIPAVSNYAHNLRARFGSQGIEVQLRDELSAADLRIRLSRWGREGTSNSPGAGLRRAWDNRVEYQYRGITEWWVNAPRGLEQGFTITAAPSGDRRRPLILDLEVTGGWRAEAAAEAIHLRGPQGERLRYSGLHVTGADGAEIDARLSVHRESIRIMVEDRNALYPVTVDPILTNQEQKLLGNLVGGKQSDEFGFSVALDLNTALVGAPADDTVRGASAGSAYVFFRNAGIWSQEAILHAGDGAVGDRFGASVALSGDTALVGANGADTTVSANAGAAFVFVRFGTSWSQQAKLQVFDGAASDQFGFAVALRGDTALVGAYSDDNVRGSGAGSAYVFVRSGANWTGQVQLLTNDGAAGDEFGYAVALTGNASSDTAVIGARFNDTATGVNAGSAYVFVRSGTVWTEQDQLFAGDAAEFDLFGSAVAVSGDTALVGASFNDTDAGAASGSAYVFVRSGTNWSEQVQLSPDDAGPSQYFGNSVALSGDIALVGAYVDDTAGGITGSADVFVRTGSIWSQEDQLLSSDAAAGDNFGISVALSGATAIVGAHHDDTAGGADAGSATVFTRTAGEWSQQMQLLPSDATPRDLFGSDVALSGDTAIVGVPDDDGGGGVNAGSAYVFTRSGTSWTRQAQLLASDGAAEDGFGHSVAISGNTVIVGAPEDDTPRGLGAGSVYIFGRLGSSWSQQAHLLDTNATAGDQLGISVAIDGNTAIAGAFRNNVTATNAGAAFVFVRSGSTWTQARLLAGDGATFENFGVSVALQGDTALVGAQYGDNSAGVNTGSVYAFVRSGTTWTEQQELLPGDGAASDFFGYSVALSGGTAAIGAYQAGGAGRGYVFVRNGTSWSEQFKLQPSDGASGDNFGYSVAINGDLALVGARNHDTAVGSDAGSAYLFARSGVTWTQQLPPLTADDGARFDAFGHSVALGVGTALVGAPGNDHLAGEDAGAAYVFRLNAAPSITAAAALARAGGNSEISTIATVADAEDAAGTLTVSVTVRPAGITFGPLTNTNGTITAGVGASCSATAGAKNATLQVQDSGGGSSTATLTIHVTANTPPILGEYPDTTLDAGGSVTVTPSAAPTDDNGLPYFYVASWQGFTGTISADSATGVVSFSNANAGSHTIIVSAEDNCLEQTNKSFTLTVNPSNLRGDSNGDGAHSIADVIYLLSNLFGGGAPPATLCAGDADADMSTTIEDAFFLINHFFFGGPAPTPCT